MKDKVFIDSNILLYCYSEDELRKHELATTAINEVNGFVSTQVLSEVCNVALKKLHEPNENVRKFILEASENFQIHQVTVSTIVSALKLQERFQLPYYDAQIIAAALERECSILYSEDLQDGQVFDGSLKVINPLKQTEIKSL